MLVGIPYYGSATVVSKIDPVLNFGPNAFVSINTFYIGSRTDSVDPMDKAVVLNQLMVSPDTGVQSLRSINLAPEMVKLNPAPGDNDAPKETNPVFNKNISVMSLQGTAPIVVLATDDTAPILGPNQKVCNIANIETVFANKEKLNDAAGMPTSGVVGLTASLYEIFAAVKPSGAMFGDDDSGIILLLTKDRFVEPTNSVTGVRAGNLAVKLDKNADVLLAITQDGFIGEIIDMHWDETTSRLYVALQISRDNPTANGGVVALLVGRVDKSDTTAPFKLILEPATPLDASFFETNKDDHIIGFSYGGGDGGDIFSSLYKVRTLHTTTNKSYVVVNGSVSTGDVHNKVFVLPIVKQFFDGMSNTVPADEVGKIAKKGDATKVVSSLADMTRATDPGSIVGGGDLPITADQEVREIYTRGDAVFVSVSGRNDTGARDSTHESGIFSSTALFNKAGCIRGWTPWQRVMGSVDRVLGGGIDAGNGVFMYLTGAGTDARTIKVTQWGRGSNNGLLGGTDGNESLGLVSLLNNEFSWGTAGVHQLFDFDNETPSFKAVVAMGNIALMIATGYKKVSLIETGRRPAASPFVPNIGDFRSSQVKVLDGIVPVLPLATQVLTMEGGTLDSLGPLCCAEVARVPLAGDSAKGWLFVGGHTGLGVLSTDAGAGWDTSAAGGLSSGFGGLAMGMTFKKLGTIDHIRQLACDGEFLYVLTRDALLRMSLSAANFSLAGAVSPTITVIGTPLGVTGDASATFLDLVISSKVAFIGTTHGLFRVADAGDVSAPMVAWTEVFVDKLGPTSLGPVSSLTFISATKGGTTKGGNLIVFAADFAKNLGQAYRFNIADTSASPVGPGTIESTDEIFPSHLFLDLGVYRGAITLDGATLFHILPQHFEDSGFLKAIRMVPNLSNIRMRGAPIPLDLDPLTAHNVGILRRNSASGSWIIPGDWGVRVNE